MVIAKIFIDGCPLEDLMIPGNIYNRKIIIPKKSMKKAEELKSSLFENKI